jgi:hypothetical protein
MPSSDGLMIVTSHIKANHISLPALLESIILYRVHIFSFQTSSKSLLLVDLL